MHEGKIASYFETLKSLSHMILNYFRLYEHIY